MIPFYFSTWGKLKTLVYSDETETLDKLKENIEQASAAIKANKDSLQRTSNANGHFKNFN